MLDNGFDGPDVDRLMNDLFPLLRSITGEGTRATLRRIGEAVPLGVSEVPSGSPVLDWTVPDEWNLGSARLYGPDGDVVVDSADLNLHVVNYSEPTTGTFALDDLQSHLHSLEDRPSLVPYRTSYYSRTWGFCLTHDLRRTLEPGDYGVEIEGSLEPGSLSYGECFVPGRARDEVLITTHVCHPSMANDNLSGIAAAVALARWALAEQRELSYRFVFAPATIGAICWLAANRDTVGHVRHGLVLAGLGDSGPLLYKRSRRGNAVVDRAMTQLVAGKGTTMDWYPYGYDERQYNSPGFDLPVGRLSRTMHGTYPEYHTSGDDLAFVDSGRILEAVEVVTELFDLLESELVPRNLAPYGEPQLGRRELYRSTGGALDSRSVEMAYLWLLSLADGDTDLVEIASRSQLPLPVVVAAAADLRRAELLG